MSHMEALKAYRNEDYSLAKELWIDETDKGNDQAMVNLGLLYLKGEGVQKDFALAKEWFEKAMKYENSSAYYNLALMYQSHIGVEEDLDKALLYFQKAHKLGHTNASFRLGIWLLKDRSDVEKTKEGFEAMLHAAKNGHAMAKMQMGGIEHKLDKKKNLNISFRKKLYEEKKEIIEDTLNRYIRPILIKDGGNIVLIDFIDTIDAEIRLAYQGNCAGCSMATTGTYSIIFDTFSKVIDENILVYVI
jgi:uncharacterized protein